jgi:hypothetical protein
MMMPVEVPEKAPSPKAVPQKDPERTLNPRRLCPDQQDDLTRIIRRKV